MQVSLTCIICKLVVKEVKDYLLDHFWAITSSAIIVNTDSSRDDQLLCNCCI